MRKLIYDIGMHKGYDTEFYLKKGFNVIGIEAIPEMAQEVGIRLGEYVKTGQLVIINKAIHTISGKKINFYVNKSKDDWGTALEDWNREMSSDFEKITVQSICLQDIIKEYGTPYFMKIDIEGSDLICLKSLLEMQLKIEHLSVELMSPNNLTTHKVNCLEILAHLSALGYKQFKISDQSKNSFVKCPNPALEGNYVEQKFNGECSGLFGKELQTASYSLDEVAVMYLDFFYPPKRNLLDKVKNRLFKIDYKKLFHHNGWFDVHVSSN